MHRILLREVVIDVPATTLNAARDFWAGALLAEARVAEGHPEFIALDRPASLCVVGMQDIGSDSARLHLDIETDDVEAEVARLARLGAVEQGRHRSWVVMRDPGRPAVLRRTARVLRLSRAIARGGVTRARCAALDTLR